MLEGLKEALDKGNSVSAVFTDLCKTFDTLNQDLLTAKPGVYGFSDKFLSYITRMFYLTGSSMHFYSIALMLFFLFLILVSIIYNSKDIVQFKYQS